MSGTKLNIKIRPNMTKISVKEQGNTPFQNMININLTNYQTEQQRQQHEIASSNTSSYCDEKKLKSLRELFTVIEENQFRVQIGAQTYCVEINDYKQLIDMSLK